MHREALHSEGNTATERGSRKDEKDLTREGLLYVIQRQHIDIFLAEALVYACHLVNRFPSFAIGGKTPLEVWLEKVA